MRLSWKEVYTKANVNPSTSAFQRDRFLSFFSYTGEGRNRKYEEESVEILSLISSMYADGKTFDAITEALEHKHGVPTDIVVSNTSTTQLDIIEGIRSMLADELSSRDEAIEKLSQQVNELAQGSQERDRLLMETLISIRERDKKKKNWWKILNGG